MPINPLLKSKGSKPRTGKIKNCLECGKEVYRRPSELNKKYCSLDCYNKAQTQRTTSLCHHCGGEYWVAPSRTTKYGQKYCSLDCYRDANPRKPKVVGNRRKGLMARVKLMAQRYARLRDCGGTDGYANCISCGELKHFSNLDGGHFIPATHSALRFTELNINAQCVKCNRFLHGNQWHYAQGIIKRYGQEALDELAAKESESKNWTLGELDELYDYYKAKIAEYE